MTDEKSNQVQPEPAPEDSAPLTHFAPPKDASVLPLRDSLSMMGLAGPRVPAEKLIDTSFVVYNAKSFRSSYQHQAHAYFCACVDDKTGEMFTTVLGGSAVVDVLDILVQSGFDHPVRVTLRWIEGGRFKGYYILE